MSFSDAIGHVDQIVQWEQQLADPAALTQPSGTAATGTSTNTSSSDASGGASFSNALAQAQAEGGTSALAQSQGGTSALSLLGAAAGGATPGAPSPAQGLLSGGDSQLLSALQSATGATGLAGATGLTGATGAPTAATAFDASAASVADPRIQSMIQEADSLVGKPYVWGGGHNDFGPQSGYDCSGFVSAVLHAGGYLSSPQDTETLPSAPGIASGPGQYVTIYDRTTPGQEGHVIIEIAGQFYESGGEQGSWGGGGGVARIATPSASYLASFNQVLHPAGL